MQLSKIIIHELKKNSDSEVPTTRFSAKCLPLTDDMRHVNDLLASAFKEDNREFANFGPADQNEFPTKILKYLKTQKTEGDFRTFSIEVLTTLRELIKTIPWARGGDFAFVECILGGEIFLFVYLLRRKETMDLYWENDIYTVKPEFKIDTEKLAMACRINLASFEAENTSQCINLYSKTRDVSKYFHTWLGSQHIENTKEFTQTLYDLMSSIELPIDPETEQTYDRTKFLGAIYIHVKSSQSKRVDFRSIGQHFFGDPQKLQNYAQETEKILPEEFKPDLRIFKKFTQVNVRKDGIHLEFPRGELGRKVFLSEDNLNRVFIVSRRFADALRLERQGD